MTKFKFFFDFSKEEKWLNSMAKKGYQLISKGLGYEFKKTVSENVNIRIDYRPFKRAEDYVDYCTMLEDRGWKHIAGKQS